MKKIAWVIIGVAIITGGIFALNHFTLEKPVTKTISSDVRNAGIQFTLHYKNYVNTDILVFNLKNISKDKAVADVFRVLLQTASALSETEFKTVELAFRGKTKFKIRGEYFHKIGIEYETQNPIYTMRTFPENVLNEEGEEAYSSWSGGLFGVLEKQMEDFNDFNEKWYLKDLSEEWDKN